MATYTIPTKTYIDNQDATKVNSADLISAIGNINSPLLDMSLKNSLAMKAGVGSVIFSRASTATYIDRYGVLKTVQVDEPRFEKEGYLNEGSSTNLLTYSEQFNDASWNKTGATVTANTTATLDPYGTNVADKLIESALNENHYISKAPLLSANTAYNYTIFAKAAERSMLVIQANAGMVSAISVIFDLSNGTIYSGTGGTIKAIGNGWYRCSIVNTTNATAEAKAFLYGVANPTISYQGDGTSGIYIFGAQLEALPFASSYIPTGASAVTRAADIEKSTLYGNTPSLAGDFTVLIDAKSLIGTVGTTSLNRHLLSIGTEGSGLIIRQGTTGNLVITYGSSVLIDSASYPLTAKTRIGVTKTGTTVKGYINGVMVATKSVVNVSVSDATFQVGCSNSFGGQFYGSLSNVRMYDFALTPQEVALA